MEEKNFSVYLPAETQTLEKSLNGKEHGNYVRGWATTPDQDQEGDIVLPGNLDISYFINRGSINYEHQMGAQYHIGTPTANTYIDPARGLFVEAKLDMENPYARKMWDMARRAESRGKHLGFSIEGRFSGRDATNPNVITTVQVKEVALTTNPANKQATWERLTKSLTTGTESNPAEMSDGGAIRRESLANKITSLKQDLSTASPESLLNTAQDLNISPRELTEEGLFSLKKGNTEETQHLLVDPAPKQLEEQPEPKTKEKEDTSMADNTSQELAQARAQLEALQAKQAEFEKQQNELLEAKKANAEKEAELARKQREAELVEQARKETEERIRKEYEEKQKAEKEPEKPAIDPALQAVLDQVKAQGEAMHALQEQLADKKVNQEPATASTTPAESKAVVTTPPTDTNIVTPTPLTNQGQVQGSTVEEEEHEPTVAEMSMEEVTEARREAIEAYERWFHKNVTRMSADQVKDFRLAISGLRANTNTESNFNIVKEINELVEIED